MIGIKGRCFGIQNLKQSIGDDILTSQVEGKGEIGGIVLAKLFGILQHTPIHLLVFQDFLVLLAVTHLLTVELVLIV